MKHLYLLLMTLGLLLSHSTYGQTSTETFETESQGSNNFTDNGVVFDINSINGTFTVVNFPSEGWSGTDKDNKFIDNTHNVIANPSFSIKTTSNLFKVNKFWIFLSNPFLDLSVQGTLTVTGKLSGVTKFSQIKTDNFNTSKTTTNGFTLIDLTNLNEQNFSNIVIDELVITAGGNYQYMALDAFTWVKDSNIVLGPNLTISQNSLPVFTTCSGSTSTPQSFTISGNNLITDIQISAPTGYEISTTTEGSYQSNISIAQSSGTVTTTTIYARLKNTATATPSGNIAVTSTNATTQNVAVTGIVIPGPSITTQPGSSKVCAGGTTTFSVAASNATSYQWQVDTGSGFTNISNSAPYSGVTSATLTITGAMAGMNGYNYHVIVSGSCTPATTSNSATLNVSNISATTSTTPASCFGGSNGTATVIPSGGIAPYTYSWSPSGSTAATATGLAAGTYSVTIKDNIGCIATINNIVVTQPTTELTASTSKTDVSCNGGSNGTATVSPSGGTPSYTYSWAPSGGNAATATGLAVGTYICTITDANGCQATRSITIMQPPALNVTTSKTDVSCNGGSNGVAAVNVTGGTGPYTYSWAPIGGTAATTTGLVAGSYTCTITDANGCQATRSITIMQPPTLTATVQQTDTTIGSNNGAASITVTGGTPPYTYLWTPSGGTTATATGLAAGTYTCVITDANSCSMSKTITINTTNPTAYKETFENIPIGGMQFTSNGVTFTISENNQLPGMSNILIQNMPGKGWNGLAPDNQFIDYNTMLLFPIDISIKSAADLFSIESFWMSISQNGTLIYNLPITITGLKQGATVFTTSYVPLSPLSAKQKLSTMATPTNGYFLVDARNLNGGDYSNYVIDELRISLTAMATNVLIDAFTWVKNSGTLSSININKATKKSAIIYPNPVKETLNIQTEGKVDKIAIYNLSGTKIIERTINNKNIDVHQLPAGTYIIQIHQGNLIENIKFIKQ